MDCQNLIIIHIKRMYKDIVEKMYKVMSEIKNKMY